ncbi:tetratricopeptide repeat protein [Allorhodopirellula solitaria]|uniref:Outer membrane protein assembly factor BamD n=1 Tax=Allorhodopirellula solitaria TaxID=2527987 RepID=A0A5C5YJL3_9BACT|nr:tetratricopeptide repeat protein [Allorhodopirellula solitaria]TWT75070.1 Outer membrane protein assembly factor BamD [Allorhodopirellula solitaria]
MLNQKRTRIPARRPLMLALVLSATIFNLPCSLVAQETEGSVWESSKRNADRVARFVTGREQSDPNRARELYQEADSLFRTAAHEATATARDGDSEGQEKSKFEKAAKLFHRAAEAEPDSALSQDALFMQGESLFFADQLPDAAEAYQKLQKDFPRNRHSDRVASRLFEITQYWIDTEKARAGSWWSLNLFDPTRPRLDVDGHAIRVLDQIRYDDPTGRLADDATMAAAAEYIRQGNYEMANEFLTDLRDTFPDSEHFFIAHLLGIRAKLEIYGGPRYSGLMLEEAEKLIEQTRQRFPDKMQEQETADMIARAAAEVAYRRAEHLFERAQYREKRSENRAAAKYYQNILDNYPSTPLADKSRERLEAISGLPPVPPERLTWLKAVFPDSQKSTPLITKFESPESDDDETMLR